MPKDKETEEVKKVSVHRPKKGPAKRITAHQKVVVTIVAFFLRLWTRTLRFRLDQSVLDFMESEKPPCVVVFWHNRLFVAPEFYRRYFSARRLAVLVSASRDGAWSEAFVESLGIQPIRGSRNRRGAQALKELIQASRAGRDISFTPDGSRGPIYDMKAGAVAVAMNTGAPILLLSFNFHNAWRLKSWDQHFIPLPFQKVDVLVDYVGTEFNDASDAKLVSPILKKRLDAITIDDVGPQ